MVETWHPRAGRTFDLGARIEVCRVMEMLDSLGRWYARLPKKLVQRAAPSFAGATAAACSEYC
jgi:hypothetical protein